MELNTFDFIAREQERQDRNIELIASENFVSENVMRAVGSCLTNKYSEGYPVQRESGNCGRYYGGCEVVNDLPLIEASDVSYTFPYAPERLRQRATKVVDTIREALDDSMGD